MVNKSLAVGIECGLGETRYHVLTMRGRDVNYTGVLSEQPETELKIADLSDVEDSVGDKYGEIVEFFSVGTPAPSELEKTSLDHSELEDSLIEYASFLHQKEYF